MEQNTINDDSNENNSNQNNVRLPSYSSIDLEDTEISVKINKYDLKRKINNIKLFGYVVFVLNSLYFIFSMLVD